MDSNVLLRETRLDPGRVADMERFPFTLPAVRALEERLAFHPQVTFLIGENGSGKSTIIEALAAKLDLDAEGGDTVLTFVAPEYGPLAEALVLVRGTRRPSMRYFLRAESFFNVAREVDAHDGALQAHGGRALHAMSHGESFNDTAAGLATAQGLVAVTPDSSAPVVLLADDDRLGDSLDATGLRLSRVLSVGAVERALGPALLLDTTLEAIARAKHERYVQLELSRGQTAMDNPSLVGWEELPESLKESNRRFADSLARKIRELGGRVTPRDPTAPPATELPLPLHVLEELAQAEHARWVEDLRADGWRLGEEDKDPVRKVHPLMVPWDDLPHEEQEKDRDAIRDLPALVEAAGLTLVLETDDAQSTGRDEGGLEGPIHEEAAG